MGIRIGTISNDILFDIPDIRYFWMEDEKFLSQFESGKITKFIPFSPLESIHKDISLYVLSKDMDKQIDSFYNKKISSQSYCFRLIYSPKNYKITNPGEFNDIINKIQTELIVKLKKIDWLQIRG